MNRASQGLNTHEFFLSQATGFARSGLHIRSSYHDTGSQLRELFMSIFSYSNPSDPRAPYLSVTTHAQPYLTTAVAAFASIALPTTQSPASHFLRSITFFNSKENHSPYTTSQTRPSTSKMSTAFAGLLQEKSITMSIDSRTIGR
jgi:hypothetical protein